MLLGLVIAQQGQDIAVQNLTGLMLLFLCFFLLPEFQFGQEFFPHTAVPGSEYGNLHRVLFLSFIHWISNSLIALVRRIYLQGEEGVMQWWAGERSDSQVGGLHHW